MEVLLVKETLANGLASPASVQLERKLRSSRFWSHLGNKRLTEATSAIDCNKLQEPALLVRDGDSTTVFTDVASVEQFSQMHQPAPVNPEAACW